MARNRIGRETVTVIASISIVAIILLLIIAATDSTVKPTNSIQAPSSTKQAEQVNPPSQTTPSLAYLIEEEKLAHDVYVTLGDKWGSRVFGNILQSESTHQGLVAPLLEARNISDPRLASVGAFTDPSLQKLYDQLIAQGMQSEASAYDVGIIIEKTDIADLDKMLSVEKDQLVIAVLNKLKQGSENHLRAFERQLNR